MALVSRGQNPGPAYWVAHHHHYEGQAEPQPATPQRVATYARVSPAENKSNLDSQAERLVAYSAARDYQVAKVVKEVGSGINVVRPKLLALLDDQSISMIVVEHKDRLTRFGFRCLDTLLETQGRAIEVVNQAENGAEDLLADLTAMRAFRNPDFRSPMGAWRYISAPGPVELLGNLGATMTHSEARGEISTVSR